MHSISRVCALANSLTCTVGTHRSHYLAQAVPHCCSFVLQRRLGRSHRLSCQCRGLCAGTFQRQRAPKRRRRSESARQWRASAAKAASVGGKLAHWWTKEETRWAQQVVRDQGGCGSPTIAQHVAPFCGTASPERQPSRRFQPFLRSPPALSGIRSASSTFAGGTSLADGFHPRHSRLSSDEALEGLCRTLNFSESLGDMPSTQRSVLIAMLSTPTGGCRPFGL